MSRKIAAGCRIGGSVRSKPAASRQSSARSPGGARRLAGRVAASRRSWLAESGENRLGHQMALMGLWLPLTKLVRRAAPNLAQGERSVRSPASGCRRSAGHGRMTKGAPPNHAWSRPACDEACVRIAPVALGRSRLVLMRRLGARARRKPIGSTSTRRGRRLPPLKRRSGREPRRPGLQACAPRATRSPSRCRGRSPA